MSEKTKKAAGADKPAEAAAPVAPEKSSKVKVGDSVKVPGPVGCEYTGTVVKIVDNGSVAAVEIDKPIVTFRTNELTVV